MQSPAPLRLVVLLSGGGRTLLNLVEAIRAGTLRAEIPLVISSRRDVAGVERARRAGLAVEILRPRDFPDRPAFDAALAARLAAVRPDLVVLAGYLLHVAVPAELEGRVLNIHPSLLPRHGGPGMFGEHVHAAVLASGERESGCTVHVVDEHYDHGPVIAQARVPVLPGDSPETLGARVFAAECATYPAAIAAHAASLPPRGVIAGG
jgi:formyltetrahydrofolate-dependent phosphoribosylglycinamide formyltransferase